MFPELLDLEVIYYFALFHDCKRLNEDTDIEHGRRSAGYFMDMLHTGADIRLSDKALAFDIAKACYIHSTAEFASSPNIAMCLDADRLDLYRVLIYPDIARLHFQYAYSYDFIEHCTQRSASPSPVSIYHLL